MPLASVIEQTFGRKAMSLRRRINVLVTSDCDKMSLDKASVMLQIQIKGNIKCICDLTDQLCPILVTVSERHNTGV